jgi:hypothetical protein
MTLTAIAFAIATSPVQTITYEEMEAKMHEAYRALTDYKEVFAITIAAGEQAQLLRVERLISGPRNRVKVSVNGTEVSETGFDGLTLYAVLHPERVYQMKQGTNDAFQQKYAPADLSKEEDGFFNFVPQNIYGIRIEVKPAAKVISEEVLQIDGKPHKKIVAESPKIAQNDHLRITYVFHPDRWIISSFEVDAKSRSGNTLLIKGAATEAKFSAGLTQKDFAFDVGAVPGYRRVGG